MSSESETTQTVRTTKPRLRFGALAIALALIAAACGGAASDTSVLGGDDASSVDVSNAGEESVGDRVNFQFNDFDGQEIDFSEFSGDGPVVINVFAAWCATCVAELPDFETVSNNLASDVQFLGLSFQDRPEDSIALIETTGVTFQTGFDTDGAIFSQFQGLGLPTTVFIDENGEVVTVHSGVLTEASLTEAIEEDLLS